MKERLKQIVESFEHYNSKNMAYLTFGFDEEMEYDALVVAPGFTPYKLNVHLNYKVTTLRESTYIAGYLVEKDNLKIAWIKTASSASNVIDHMAACARMKIKKLIFIGAVGALTPKFGLGDICTPTYCVAGGFANTYLKDSLRDFVPFERIEPDMKYVDSVIADLADKGYGLRKASVYCTDSIACEYAHLDEIKGFGTDLIEMETSSFYRMSDLMEIPGIALLVVSDNSATGAALIGRTEEEQKAFNNARRVVLPEMIFEVALQA